MSGIRTSYLTILQAAGVEGETDGDERNPAAHRSQAQHVRPH